ncbi:thioesterase II family protein [Streptomyces drozdowiczii]|uniref:Alpha/beta fold hydrolase n=1 Tax=Streptomyces drozdowiczii TaxID=202862 RepID=A0ABY6Q0V7_9ACTN|nr:alpha/beta fold hydrolase [Streptomyces drozdowiczii]MCX0241716.1 alpha/beta fold hydrolase [Streptomyces drozdowiczii]UZK58063.1 alpha/beta fold hydrolase [Streptomyces drozdowiczii]
MAWMECVRAVPGAAFRVVCFPHAGGTAAFFRHWASPGGRFEVYAVRYPGRAERAAEPCATEVRGLAAGVAPAVAALADRPVALFGHSMGAWAAFETALLLERDGVSLSHLFVSGASAPPARPAPAGLETASPDELAATLVRLGGTDPALLEDPGLLDRYFPYIRADLLMASRYAADPADRVGCPVTGVLGDADPVTGPGQAAGWSHRTTGGFRQLTFSGGHFYLADDPPLALVDAELAASPLTPL